MPMYYYDRMIEKDIHPGLEPNPAFSIERVGIKGQSVFMWDHATVLKVYKWYVVDYKDSDIEDEFGVRLSKYDFNQILINSYYSSNNEFASSKTIKEAYEYEESEKRAKELREDSTAGLSSEHDEVINRMNASVGEVTGTDTFPDDL